MVNFNKIRIALFAFLAFCVLSSKNIIIYNEETLVALSFVAFIYFVFQYLGSTVRDSLNERSDTIKIELQNFLNLKKESLEQLLKEHKKVLNLRLFLRNISEFSKKELVATALIVKQAFHAIFYQQIEQRLSTLSLSSLPLQQKLQQLMAKNIFISVLLKLQKKKINVISPKTITNTLRLVAKKAK